MARLVRADRVRASQRALGNMHPRAARLAKEKAREEGRTFPTSAQRRAAQRAVQGGR